MSAQINFQDVTASRGSQGRNIAAAMFIAGVAVVGTGGMAWSALSMALDSPLKQQLETDSAAATAPAQTGHEAVEGFAEGTRAQASSAKPAQAPAPLVIEGPALSTTDSTSPPVQRPTSAPVVQASTTGVTPQQPAATTTSEERSRLGQVWATGVFR
jgi:hypothetical protein